MMETAKAGYYNTVSAGAAIVIYIDWNEKKYYSVYGIEECISELNGATLSGPFDMPEDHKPGFVHSWIIELEVN